MSWECAHLRWIKKDGQALRICRLNGQSCTPGHDRCVLKGRFVTTATLRQNENSSKKKTELPPKHMAQGNEFKKRSDE